ncbi:hypothetical protein [Acidithiobacillus ferrooxidans]|uniref:Uncharacterized protein n=1 Tax=Acidithiobacillus ferrooxidans TaxID=920 RepID=A0A2W1K6K4_ACIFR|nr:hypothetical protein [Acidithiobacillus ferrooxidans]MBU2819398.1 hypothetical protein [Acidithiobacillus ferrooxidans]MCR1344065.1 hypothetical protein [Acidithiobacillus ferrooxidans]PZD82439.1 hypothetical protein DN052_05320 [Acidithiobacillus ferrooxidans]QLK41287.1 hypothetical protein FE661_03245 [Acidithiobacillus ferrooxidans]QZT53228.1 hypothetical protein K7B00_03240 [Acidithiobacillus ferrooxidans]
MLVSVHTLRVRGRRIGKSEIPRAAPTQGDLRTHYQGVILVATLEPALPRDSRPLPPLYDPRIMLISPQAIRLMGFEKVGEGDGATTYLQEWLCETK